MIVPHTHTHTHLIRQLAPLTRSLLPRENVYIVNRFRLNSDVAPTKYTKRTRKCGLSFTPACMRHGRAHASTHNVINNTPASVLVVHVWHTRDNLHSNALCAKQVPNHTRCIWMYVKAIGRSDPISACASVRPPSFDVLNNVYWNSVSTTRGASLGWCKAANETSRC